MTASSLHAGTSTPPVTATQDDGVALGSPVTAGSSLTYTVKIQNTSAGVASGVTLSDPAPANTSDVPNTLSATPVAVDDVYPQPVIANMSVNTAGSGFSVVSNDFKGFAAGVGVPLSSISVAVAAGPAHGSLELVTSGANVGTFTYTPTAGYTGADGFTYTLSNGVAGGDLLSTTGSVSLTVSGPLVWYVDAVAGDDAAGDGSLAKPFKTLTKASSVDGPGQTIFMYSGSYGAGLVLENGETLVGQGAVGSFDVVLGIAPGSDTPARPALSGTNPTLNGGIVLGSGNSLNGLTCGSFAGTSIGGTGFGTLAVTHVTINNGSGPALVLSNGTLGGSGFSAVSSAAGANNVSLTNIAGTFGLGGGALGGASSDAFVMNGGAGSITYVGTISNATAKAVLITGKTGGTVTLSGNVSSTGTGINLGSNTGAVINFTGTLTASTGTSTAFSATGGGTVSASDPTSTLTTTTATALNVANTTIGAGGLVFTSITAGAGPNNGIVLDTTGTSGGLSVTGSGSANSGGVISGKTGSDGSTTAGSGIYLNNTSNVALANISLQGNQNYGIRGNNVTGFALDHSLVGTLTTNGTSSTADIDATGFQGEGGVRFYNLLGTATISNSTLDNGFSRTLAVSNDGGTLTNLTLSNSVVRNSLTASTASDAMYLQSQGAATIANLTVTAGTQFSAARQCAIQTSAKTGSTMNIAIDGSSFKNTNASVVSASNLLVFNGTGTNTWVTFNLSNNSFTQGNGVAAAPVDAGRILTAGMVNGSGTFFGKITGNTFGVSGLANSAGGSGADAIGLFAAGNNGSHGGSRFLVQNNIVQNYGQSGIQIAAVDGSATADATVLDNIIRQPGNIAQGAFAGIWAYSGNNPGDTNTLNIAIGGSTGKNTLVDSDPSNSTDVFLGNTGVATAILNLFKNGSVSTSDHAVLVDDNVGPLDLFGNTVGTITLQTGLPTAPPLLAASGGIQRTIVTTAAPAMPASVASIAPITRTAPATLAAAPPPPAATVAPLGQAVLDLAVAAAIERWQASGLNAGQVAVLRQLRFEAADLPDFRLGEAAGNLIRVSRNAGGNEWFVDSGATSDVMFGTVKSATLRYTDPAAAAAGHMDLLTAILHEMGHALGLDDTYAMGERGSLMYGELTLGERRLPLPGQAAGALPFGSAHSHFLAAPVVIGTLPAGKSVHLTYQVQINDPVTSGTTQITSQGTVSGSNFITVLTDDPETAAASDATVTLLAIPPVVNTQPVSTMVIAGQPASFTATASGAPIPAVQWQESSNGSTFSNVAGAVSGTFAFTPTLLQNGHTFRAVFTNSGGTDTSNAATLTVVTPPSLVAAFGASSVPLNGSTTLTYTITNPSSNTLALTGVAFTDTLPAGLVVATPNGQTGTVGGGTVTALAGTGSVSLAAASVPANSSISFAVNVTGTTAGVKNNSAQVTSTEGGTGNTSNASLTVVAAPVIIQALGAASIPLNGSTSLTFTVQNNNTTSTLTGVAFTETLPAGLVVATPNGLAGSAGGGTITAVAGSNTVTVSGAGIAQSSSFTFAINVSGTTAGTKNLTTGNVSSTEGGSGGTASASINVIAPPVIVAAFGASNIAINGTTSLTFTLTNPAANAGSLTGVAFTNTLPAGLVVATPNGLSNTAGGTATAVAGSGSITLTGGTIAAGASATLVVNVTGTTSGVKNDTTGSVSSTNGGTGGTASASITVATPPSLVAAFGASSVPLNGSTTLTYTITNPSSNTLALTGVAFTDTLPAGLVVATPNGQTGTVGGGTVTALAGTGSVSLAAASVPANSSISFAVNVTGTTAGVKNNSAQVTSTEGGTGNTSNASLTVVAAPVIIQALGAASIPLNGSTSLTFTVQNNNTTSTLTGVAFTETLPAGLVVATPNGLAGSAGGGTITAVAGSNTVTVSGAGIAQSSSFTFAINVSGTTAGTKNLTTGNVSSTEGGSGGTASASINVIAPPVIVAAFGASNIAINGTTSLTFTLTNPAANAGSLTGVAFTNTLPAGLVVATPNGLSNTAGGTATAVAGSGSITLTGGTIAAGASATLVVNVTGTTSGVKNDTTGSVSSTNGGTGGTASASLTVRPPVDHFAISAPSAATAGAPVTVTVTAQDIANATVPDYTGTVHFTSSDGSAVLPANSTLTSGVGTFAVTLKTSGSQTVAVNDASIVTLTGTSGPIIVGAAAADHLAFTQQPTNATAGASISPALSVRVLDVFNNGVTTDGSNITLALGTNPGSGTLSGTKTVAAVAGVATFSGLSINKTGAGYTLVASDGGLTGATSAAFTITPAAASVVVFTSVPAGTTAGVSLNFVVMARDSFGNAATGFTGTLHFTSSDAAAVLPANYTFVAGDSGSHTFSATLQTTGSRTITATDTENPSITGTSSAVSVAELVSIAATDANAAVTGGDTGTYRFTRSGSGGSFTVNFQLDAASTALAADFSLSGAGVSFTAATGAGTVSFPNGSTTVDLTLTAAANASGAAKPALTAQLDVASGSGYASTPPNQATVIIAQNGFVVVNTNDAGAGSLRQAILNANALPGTDTITFGGTTFTDASVPDVITLTSGELTITSPLNIMGPGANALHISANHSSRVLNLVAGSYGVRLDGLTLRDGAVSDQSGAGIQSSTSGSLTITRCVIRDNQLTNTGGTVEQGAGIYQAAGQLIIRDSALSGNAAVNGWGGAVSVDKAASLQLVNSTVSGNQANQGAGIWINPGSLVSIIQSTLSANAATTNGGGIFNNNGAVTLANSLVAANAAPAQPDLYSAAPDPGAGLFSLGGNLLGSNSTGTSTFTAGLPNASADFVGTAAAPLNPVVGPLANNGGPTPTIALLNGSPAINAGKNSNIPADTFDQNANSNLTESIPFDQRGSGFARVIGTTVDAGAFEAFAFEPTLSATTTDEDVMSSSGLVITANSADGGLTTHYKITGILHGTLYQNNGTTVIAAGSFITKAQGAAGLKFLADANLNGVNTPGGFGFSAQAAVGNTDANLRGTATPVVISVTPVNDPPTVVAPGIADQIMLIGQNFPLPLAPDFADIEGDTLSFSVMSNSNSAVASAAISGSSVTLSAHASGLTDITIQANDGHGGTVTDTFAVAVGTTNPTPLQIGTTGALNRQDGLFELTTNVTNTTPRPLNGFRLHVNFNAYKAAYPSLRLYNASSPAGSSDVYVDYPYPLAVDAQVAVKLSFYTSTRTFPAPFAPVLTVETLTSSQVSDTNGNGVQPRLVTLPDSTIMLEFPAVIGHWYRVRYSPDMVHWSDCPVPLQAGSTPMQWVDSGPPFTNIAPAKAPSRYYIVNEIVAP
ncbi:MAG: choice-of-anchor Q domain-containing protein [Verrucomicrobiota bacterium]